MSTTLKQTEVKEIHMLLHWINRLLAPLRAIHFDELKAGAIWCQVLGKLRPGLVPRGVVKHCTKSSKDCLHNFNILKAGFEMGSLNWHFNLDDLVAGYTPELLKLGRFLRTLEKKTDKKRTIQPAEQLVDPLHNRKFQKLREKLVLSEVFRVVDDMNELPSKPDDAQKDANNAEKVKFGGNGNSECQCGNCKLVSWDLIKQIIGKDQHHKFEVNVLFKREAEK
ncbi:uncharacterized protein LOC111518892 [Drosophila willistoni]|uniref:uncharacterized protein LOC111518892 n=1 Tax=Drosophila willistoni TaxID=7260 RepID=UPI000C26D81B|nr:uncharacterized protein LOC111518892 [Drosophila willistoni]